MFHDCTGSLGTEVRTVNSPILTKLLNTEAILLNISVPKLLCGFSPVLHTQQMMELCRTQKSLDCSPATNWQEYEYLLTGACLILLHPMNKSTYCPKYLHNHEYFPIIFLCKQFLLLSQGYYWWTKGKKICAVMNGELAFISYHTPLR